MTLYVHIKANYDPAKFAGHMHSGSGDVFSLPSDFDVMMSPALSLLVSFESCFVDVTACQI